MAEFSPTRTHATWKPRVTSEHVPFFRCETCGHIFMGIDHGGPFDMRNDGERSLIAEPPYAVTNHAATDALTTKGALASATNKTTAGSLATNANSPAANNAAAQAPTEFHPECCGKPMERLTLIPREEVSDKITMDYQILGGMNHNAINVTWSVKDKACVPRWFTLKTFRGIMTKYVMPGKWPPIVFALADEDAFAYCDKDPCVECVFRCKRGMEIYAYVENIGLVLMALDHMVPPGSNNTEFEDIQLKQ